MMICPFKSDILQNTVNILQDMTCKVRPPNEDAIQQWRNLEFHRMAQHKGRNSILQHYRLRVAHVLRDYGLDERDLAPEDSRKYHQ